jgi:hypothetical protein
MTIFWSLFIFLELLVLLQGFTSYKNQFFSMKQVRCAGHEIGLPFASHVGMWLDLVLISFLAAYTAKVYHQEWSLLAITVSVLVSTTLTLAIHWFYAKNSGAIPACHVIKGKNTFAGWLHGIYMAISLSVFLLFFWDTKKPANHWPEVVAVGIATHFVVTTIQPRYVVKVPVLTFESIGQIILGLVAIGVSYFNLVK